MLTQGTNWKVEDCELALNHGFAVRVNYGIQVLNSYIHDNGQMGELAVVSSIRQSRHVS